MSKPPTLLTFSRILVTYEQFYQRELPGVAWARSLLGDFSRRALLDFSARVQSALWWSATPVDAQQGLVGVLFDEPHIELLRGFARRHGRGHFPIVVHQHQLLVLTKLALAFGSDSEGIELDGHAPRKLVPLLLYINSILDPADRKFRLAPGPDAERSLMTEYEIRKLSIDPPVDMNLMMQRFDELLFRLPYRADARRPGKGQPSVDTVSLFTAASGVSPDTFRAVVLALLTDAFKARVDNLALQPAHFLGASRFKGTAIPVSDAERVVQRLTLPADKVASLRPAGDQLSVDYCYDIVSFFRTPLFDYDGERSVCLSLPHYVQYLGSQLYDVTLAHVGADARLKQAFDDVVRDALERYVTDLFRGAAPTKTVARNRLNYKRPGSNDPRQATDCAVFQPPSLAMIEVKGVSLRQVSLRTGDLVSFVQDLTYKLVGKSKGPGQLGRAWADYQKGYWPTDPALPRDCTTAYPVVVSLNPIPQSTHIWQLILKLIADGGLLPGDCERFQLLDVEEVEMMLEDGDLADFPGILKAKIAECPDFSFRNYRYEKRGARGPTTSDLQQRAKDVWERLIRSIFPSGQHPSEA